MQELKVIENNLVPVYETSDGEKVVYGSELHNVLEVKTSYKDWSTRRLLDVDAVENEDFEAAQICAPSGQTKKDHIIKLDTAKEMAMLERNEKGKMVRRYFIQVEKKYKSVQNDLLNMQDMSVELQAIIMHDKKIQQVEHKVESVEQDLKEFKMDLPILGIEVDKITSAVKKKGMECLGGKDSNAYMDRSLRGKVYSDIYSELKRQFGVTTYKAIKRNQSDAAVDVIKQYRLPYILATQVQTENAQANLWGGAQA